MTGNPTPPASISTPVYDGVSAQSSDVQFGWSTVTPAAAGIYSLAQSLRTLRSNVVTAHTNVLVDWRGPYKREFDAKVEAFKTLCNDAAEALEGLADQYGNAWSLARYQQGKICAARGFAQRESEEGGLDKFGDSLFGDEEPNEPSQPSKPSSPAFARTGTCPHEDGCSVTPTHGSIDSGL